VEENERMGVGIRREGRRRRKGGRLVSLGHTVLCCRPTRHGSAVKRRHCACETARTVTRIATSFVKQMVMRQRGSGGKDMHESRLDAPVCARSRYRKRHRLVFTESRLVIEVLELLLAAPA